MTAARAEIDRLFSSCLCSFLLFCPFSRSPVPSRPGASLSNFPLLPRAYPRLCPGLTVSLSCPMFLPALARILSLGPGEPFSLRWSCRADVRHHRCRYPTTDFEQPTPSASASSPPLAFRRAPTRARYQPAAIPTARPENRDRTRVVGSPPVSHPTRRYATPRRALRVFSNRV